MVDIIISLQSQKKGPVAFRPTIARGLALSALFTNESDLLKGNFNAKRDWMLKPIDF